LGADEESNQERWRGELGRGVEQAGGTIYVFSYGASIAQGLDNPAEFPLGDACPHYIL